MEAAPGVKGGQVRILKIFGLVVLSLREDGWRRNLKNKGSGGDSHGSSGLMTFPPTVTMSLMGRFQESAWEVQRAFSDQNQGCQHVSHARTPGLPIRFL